MSDIRSARAAIVLVAIAAALLGCGDDDLVARAPATPIVVDGNLGEWTGAMTDLPDTHARVGVLEDGDALYVALGTDDPALAHHVERAGLTVWLDPRGGKSKDLGVVFPQPAYAAGEDVQAPQMDAAGGARTDRVELLGPEPYTRHEVDAPGEGGVQVAVGGDAEVFTYELRVPLAALPWGLGSHAGDVIGIGVATNHVSWAGGRPRGEGGGWGGGPAGGRGPGDGGPGGGGPGGGGHMGRGGFGGPRGQHGEHGGGLEAWARVRLLPAAKAAGAR